MVILFHRVRSKNISPPMECAIRQFSSDSTEVVAHFLIYPNGSVFVWVFSADAPFISDFHAATPDKFSNVPAVTTKLGELESTGRFLSLKLAKKLKTPVMVSWSLDDRSPESVATIEARLFEEIKTLQGSRVSRSSVVGA